MKLLGMIFIGLIVLILVSCDNTNPKEKATEKVTKKEVSLPVEWTKNANMYEVNIRQYSQEGTFNAFAKELPRLKKMGVDILWLMPIHPVGVKNHKGSLGSYYAVRDYKAVAPEYGTIEDFKSLVEKAHSLGMYVMIDWVANHTSWDNVWLEKHDDYYEKDSTGNFVSPFDWTDVIALDYSNANMREAMAEALKFWIAETDIDGYRCDVAGEVPTDFWEWVRPQLDAIKPVFMLAESEKPDLLNKAFNMNYGWEFHHLMNSIAKGEKNAKDVISYVQHEKDTYPSNSYMLYFLTNHDENSWNGTIKERLGESADMFAVLTYTLGGMPLTYSGQESANEKRLEFFEKDVIDWKDYPKQDFISQLIDMKHKNPLLWNGNYGGEFVPVITDKDEKVLSFSKTKGDEHIIVLLNLSPEEVSANIKDVELTAYRPIMLKGFENTSKTSFKMQPWAYVVLKK